MALGPQSILLHELFRDTPILNRVWLWLSCWFSECCLWMWNATIQRKFEGFLHPVCEFHGIIELSAKGEGQLCNEKVANKSWLPRSHVQHTAWAGAARPRHCLPSSPFSWVSRHQSVQGGCLHQLSKSTDLWMLLPTGSQEKNSQQRQGEYILKPFSWEDFKTHPGTVKKF